MLEVSGPLAGGHLSAAERKEGKGRWRRGITSKTDPGPWNPQALAKLRKMSRVSQEKLCKNQEKQIRIKSKVDFQKRILFDDRIFKNNSVIISPCLRIFF